MISRRASEICPSKTIAISQKVNELKKNGFDIIDLSIGEPDFPIPSAAKKKNDIKKNTILLKNKTDRKSQVIVKKKVKDNLDAVT